MLKWIKKIGCSIVGFFAGLLITPLALLRMPINVYRHGRDFKGYSGWKLAGFTIGAGLSGIYLTIGFALMSADAGFHKGLKGIAFCAKQYLLDPVFVIDAMIKDWKYGAIVQINDSLSDSLLEKKERMRDLLAVYKGAKDELALELMKQKNRKGTMQPKELLQRSVRLAKAKPRIESLVRTQECREAILLKRAAAILPLNPIAYSNSELIKKIQRTTNVEGQQLLNNEEIDEFKKNASAEDIRDLEAMSNYDVICRLTYSEVQDPITLRNKNTNGEWTYEKAELVRWIEAETRKGHDAKCPGGSGVFIKDMDIKPNFSTKVQDMVMRVRKMIQEWRNRPPEAEVKGLPAPSTTYSILAQGPIGSSPSLDTPSIASSMPARHPDFISAVGVANYDDLNTTDKKRRLLAALRVGNNSRELLDELKKELAILRESENVPSVVIHTTNSSISNHVVSGNNGSWASSRRR